MAKKIKGPKPKSDVAADDMQILHPERSITVAGRTFTIREYGFFDSFEVYALAESLIAALTDAAALKQSVPWPLVAGLLARHRDVVLELVTRATGVEADWLCSLSDADGQTLLMLWWGVNAPFFMRRVVTALTIAARVNAASAGPKSSPSSSATATPPNASGTTPPAS